MKLSITAVLLTLLVGCGTATRTVRLDTGQGPSIVHTPRAGARPVALRNDSLRVAVAALASDTHPPHNPQQAARQLFEVESRSKSFTYDPHNHRIIPLDSTTPLEGSATETESALTRAYLGWCEHDVHETGDCLHLLSESSTVTGDGRFTLALALSRGAVLDEMLEAFKGMADPRAMASAVLWTWTTYMILLTVPEPLTKGVAAVMTAAIICYIGVDTFWGLITGFKQLMAEAEEATTFNGLRWAGEHYGKVMGQNAARVFAMLATVALGNTASGLAAEVLTLPGAVSAAAQAGAQLGIRLAEVGAVETVAVSTEAVTIAFSAGAVAMTAHGMGSTNGHKLLQNQRPKDLPGELERAQQLEVRPVSVGDRDFLKYAKEGPIKWVVTAEGELKIIPHTWHGLELSHAVASGGEPVLAAGEADIAVQGRTTIGIEITPRSGHYLFGVSEAESLESLRIGRQVFARFGITFP